MNKRKYTFDIIHRDSFPKIILVRYSTTSDSKGDIFDSLLEVRKIISNSLSMDIFVSEEILNDAI